MTFAFIFAGNRHTNFTDTTAQTDTGFGGWRGVLHPISPDPASKIYTSSKAVSFHEEKPSPELSYNPWRISSKVFCSLPAFLA